MKPSVVVLQTEAPPCAVFLTPDLVEAVAASAAARGVTDERAVDATLTSLMKRVFELEQTGVLAAVDGRIPAVPEEGLPAMHCVRSQELDDLLTSLVISLG